MAPRVARPSFNSRPWRILCAIALVSAVLVLFKDVREGDPRLRLIDFPTETTTLPDTVSNKHGRINLPRPSEAASVDIATLTAILPVTLMTYRHVEDLLKPLLQDETAIHAVIVVCPTTIQDAVHSAIVPLHGNTLLDISVLPWVEPEDPDASVIHAAAHVTTEWTLLLSPKGIRGFDSALQDHLLNPPEIGFPVGPCGVVLTSHTKDVPYMASLNDLVDAAYLIPPFVVPNALIKDMSINSSRDSNVWEQLGRGIALQHHIGAGGLLLGVQSSNAYVCATKTPATPLSSLFGPNATVSHLGRQGAVPGVVTEMLSSPLSFAVLLPSFSTLKGFTSTLCNILSRGHEIRVLILAFAIGPSCAHKWCAIETTDKQNLQMACGAPTYVLGHFSAGFSIVDAASSWLKYIGTTLSTIIIFSGTEVTLPIDFDLEQRKKQGSTVVIIPNADLPYSDWAGTLAVNEWKNWNKPRVDISVITNNRPASLRRLLSSLHRARYFGDDVDIRINMEQTADEETQQVVRDFQWTHGRIFVHHRVIHAGLLPAVTESWYPQSDDSYCVILEDDVEVSPLFYAWAKLSLLRFRYGELHNRSPSLFGISLYQQKHIELRPEGRKPFSAPAVFDAHGLPHTHTPYLSQIPCSWGAVYFPEHWREFHAYLALRLSEVALPIDVRVAPNLRSNSWTRSWKKFFIELVHLRGYLMLYPNYAGFLSLSTNHLEVGAHVKSRPRDIYDEKLALFNLPLMPLPNATDSSTPHAMLLDLPNGEMPAFSDLPVLDLVGLMSSERELIRRGHERQVELVGCITKASISPFTFNARELFACPEGV